MQAEPVELLALPLIFQHCREKGRAPEAAGEDLLQNVKIYNYVPPEAEASYREAIVREYAAFCARRGITMSRTATYHTTVRWTGEHWGHLTLGNGPEMKFSAPPDAQGHAGVFTPEDAFVAAANTCVMLMFIWAAERFHLNLLSYECRTEGTKVIELDRTELFTRLYYRPVIRVACGGESREVVENRVHRALQAAQKYSLVANSVKSEIIVEPEIVISEKGTEEHVSALDR